MLFENLQNTDKFINNSAFQEYLELLTDTVYDGDDSEEHHALPVSMFSEYSNCRWNIVKLSLQNHYKAHELLPQFTAGAHRKSMLYAWNMMRGRYGRSPHNSEIYAQLKTDYKEVLRERMTGDKNHMKLEENKEKLRHPRPAHAILMTGENNPSKRPEVRKILSENNPMKLEENKAKFRGASNPNFGKTISDKQKAQISAAQTGRVRSEEAKEKNVGSTC